MISQNPISTGSGAASYFEAAFSKDGNLEKDDQLDLLDNGNAAESNNELDKGKWEEGRVDNYYLNEQSPAVWKGNGAEILGLRGQTVKKEDFVNFLDGKITNYNTGEISDLGSRSSKERRAGVDFTIAPSKSVSMVALVGGDSRVISAHDKANEAAMSWLERHASTIRVKDVNGDNQKIQTGNLIYATVTHETNRSNEPQLHSHNVIIYASYDQERDKWRSLTNDELFKLRSQADIVYKKELANELEKLGYEISHAKNGIDFEIKGIGRDDIEKFATRSLDIEQALSERGTTRADASWEQRSAATLNTRSEKQDIPRPTVHEIWDATAKDAGIDVKNIVDTAKERAREQETINMVPSDGVAADKAIKAVTWAIESLGEREQSFKRHEVEIEAVRFGGGSINDVSKAIDTQLSRGDMVISVNDKNSGQPLLTTPGAKKTEQQFVENIMIGRNRGNHVIDSADDFKQMLNKFEEAKSGKLGTEYKLSDEQRIATKNILMHPDAFQAIQGDAGTGKTAALEAVNFIAESKGWDVRGMATTSTAAEELQRSSGIKSNTVASFMNDRENQMILLKGELRELQTKLSSVSQTDKAKVEIGEFRLTANSTEFKGGRYVLDKESGDLVKSTENVRNWLGNLLLDFSNDTREAADSLKSGESLGGKLKGYGLQSLSDLSNKASRSIIKYESVGLIEKVEGKTNLISANKDAKQIEHEINKKTAELENLMRTGNRNGQRILFVLDESSMTGIKDSAAITKVANEIGARLVLQGDIKQHSSVPAGKAFAQAQQIGINVSTIEETRRFNNATEKVKDSIFAMKTNNYGLAIDILDKTVASNGLAETVATRYMQSMDELKAVGKEAKVGVVTLTNADRKSINAEIHSALIAERPDAAEFKKLHLDDPKLTKAESLNVSMIQSAGGDALIMRHEYKKLNIERGDILTITSFDKEQNLMKVSTKEGRTVIINPARHQYSVAKKEERIFSEGDRIEARNVISGSRIQNGKEEKFKIKNGSVGVVTAINDKGATIKWENGKETDLNNGQLAFVDLGYARTTYKEQGATNQVELFAVSQTGAHIANREAIYVALTRAKHNTEIIVQDDDTLKKLIKNSDRETTKTSAFETTELKKLADVTKAEVEQAWKKAEAGALGRQAVLNVEKIKDQKQELSL